MNRDLDKITAKLFFQVEEITNDFNSWRTNNHPSLEYEFIERI